MFTRDKDKIAQDQLNVRCMQVLRGLIHNEIMALPTDWSDSINDKNIIRWEVWRFVFEQANESPRGSKDDSGWDS